ncbi:MAG: hypothetical protein ACREDF_06665, partial [Thermoplasmata archaeon]
EHVEDLGVTLANMKTLLHPSGFMVHRVDVSTHTVRTDIHPLWQLTVPDTVWRMMYSVRAYPNRVRPATYREIAARLGLETLHYGVTTRIPEPSMEAIRPRLRARYAALPFDDLSTLDFVWVAGRERR